MTLIAQTLQDTLAGRDRLIRHAFAGTQGGRDYLLGLPDAPVEGLILMLHGCGQDAADFANGTRMDRIAGDAGFVTVWPEQPSRANTNRCWNWFSSLHQGHDGEAGLLAALAEEVAAEHGVPSGRIFVAGLSAGGAMAAVLGAERPDLFAAVGIHSGLPTGAARDVGGALSAMRAGTAGDPMAGRAIVFHGTEDGTVHPANALRITGLSSESRPERTGTRGGRPYARHVRRDPAGHPLTEFWRIEGLGHAWSGGSDEGSFADTTGPNASAEMLRFFLAA